MPQFGEFLRLNIQLHDYDGTKFVRAILRNEVGNLLTVSPVALTHVGEGLYKSVSGVTMPNTGEVTATFEVYCDAGFTKLSDFHTAGIDVFKLDSEVVTNVAGIVTLTGTVDDQELTGIVDVNDLILSGVLFDSNIVGTIEEQDVLLTGTIEDSDIAGSISNAGDVAGQLKDCT